MSPLRPEDLTPAQRARLGLEATRHRPKTGRGTTATTTMRCAACAAPVRGQAAIDRHRRATGHLRYALDLTPAPERAP